MTFPLNCPCFLDKRRLQRAFQAGSTFFECSRGMEGLMRIGWMSGFTSKHYCRLTICSAATQTARTRAQRPHTTPRSRTLFIPYRWSLLLFLPFDFFRDRFLNHSHLLQWRYETFWESVKPLGCYMVKPEHSDRSGEKQPLSCSAVYVITMHYSVIIYQH